MVGAPGVSQATTVAVTAQRSGEVAVSYLGSTDAGSTYNGYITQSRHVLAANPVFWSAAVNDPAQPLQPGQVATSALFGDRMWLLTVAFGPDGSAWAAFHCAHTLTCPDREGIAGRLFKNT